MRRWLRPLIPAASREAAMLAASEIVTNALMHGRLAAEEEIEVAVLAACGRARVRVSHGGETFAPAPVAPRADGGWGLTLVDSVSHAWGVERDGERAAVWFEV